MANGEVFALIVAGGKGQRLQSNIPKQYMKIGDNTILKLAINQFLTHPLIDGVKVVISESDIHYYKLCTKELRLLPYVIGGASRQESVLNGLKTLSKKPPDKILIHDAARPFVSHNIISNVIKLLESYKAVDLALAVTDTIKSTENGLQALNRDLIYHTQTPQGFDFKTIYLLHQKYKNFSFTDDISICIAENITVGIAQGEAANTKITHKEDLMLNQKTITRVGLGLDVHRFDIKHNGANYITVCGIRIPFIYNVIAYSDGDVGLHAITESILGAIGEGNIGTHFPNSDKQWKDADSSIFLKHSYQLLRNKGGYISNIDVTIICEEPKIMPHSLAMRQRIAEILFINPQQISVKATTTEKMGFLGIMEGIAAQAICTINIPNNI